MKLDLFRFLRFSILVIACFLSTTVFAAFHFTFYKKPELLKQIQEASRPQQCAGVLLEKLEEQTSQTKIELGVLTYKLLSSGFLIPNVDYADDYEQHYRWYASFIERTDKTVDRSRTITVTKKEFPIATEIGSYAFYYPKRGTAYVGLSFKRIDWKNHLEWKIYTDGRIVAEVSSIGQKDVVSYNMKSFSAIERGDRVDLEISFDSQTRELITPIKLLLSLTKDGKLQKIEFHSYKEDSLVVTKLSNFHSGR